jgi:predicted dehydrogenase
MSDRPSIVMAGCGRWGRNILRDLLLLGCEVHVIDPSAHARDQARAMGAASTHTKPEAAPAAAGCIIASPASTHAEVIDQLAGRGKPLFVEKPLTTDPHTAQRIADLFAGQLFMMHKWRYHPAIETLSSIAADGSLGRVTGLRTTRTQQEPTQHDTDAIWTLAPHDLTIAIEVLGRIPGPPRFAFAEGTHRGAGMIAAMGRDPWLVMEVSAARTSRTRRAEVFFEKGVVTWTDPDNSVSIREDGRSSERLVADTEAPLMRELSAFVRFLAGGPPPKSDAAEGAAVVAATAALRAMAGLH